MNAKKPLIVKCPICEPGPYSFAGTIIARVCQACIKRGEARR